MRHRGTTTAALLALTLTSCSTTPDPLPDDTAVDLLTQLDFWEDTGTTPDRATLTEFADLICENFDDGRDGWDVVSLLTETGMSGADAGAAITYASAWRCPEHADSATLE